MENDTPESGICEEQVKYNNKSKSKLRHVKPASDTEDEITSEDEKERRRIAGVREKKSLRKKREIKYNNKFKSEVKEKTEKQEDDYNYIIRSKRNMIITRAFEERNTQWVDFCLTIDQKHPISHRIKYFTWNRAFIRSPRIMAFYNMPYDDKKSFGYDHTKSMNEFAARCRIGNIEEVKIKGYSSIEINITKFWVDDNKLSTRRPWSNDNEMHKYMPSIEYSKQANIMCSLEDILWGNHYVRDEFNFDDIQDAKEKLKELLKNHRDKRVSYECVNIPIELRDTTNIYEEIFGRKLSLYNISSFHKYIKYVKFIFYEDTAEGPKRILYLTFQILDNKINFLITNHDHVAETFLNGIFYTKFYITSGGSNLQTEEGKFQTINDILNFDNFIDASKLLYKLVFTDIPRIYFYDDHRADQQTLYKHIPREGIRYFSDIYSTKYI